MTKEETLENTPTVDTTTKRTETHECDYISRQAAIDALYKMLHDCFWADDEELDAVITTLNELPSAQPENQWIIDALKEHLREAFESITENKKEFKEWLERMYWHVLECDKLARELEQTKKSARRNGKWIATQEWGGRNYSCSCCKFSFIVDTCMLEPMWNFCPNCGAEMKGEEDENNNQV